MQDPKHTRVLKLTPYNVAFVWPSIDTSGKLQPLLPERLHGRERRAGPMEGAKQLTNTLLDTDIGIQTYIPLSVVDKANR
jgi:hypothetical protein